MKMPRSGSVWQHYKGGVYEVVGVGKHSETREELIAYMDQKGELHFRPPTMWEEHVVVPAYNYEGPRFRLLEVRHESSRPVFAAASTAASNSSRRRGF